jgi:hypothetical protein
MLVFSDAQRVRSSAADDHSRTNGPGESEQQPPHPDTSFAPRSEGLAHTLSPETHAQPFLLKCRESTKPTYNPAPGLATFEMSAGLTPARRAIADFLNEKEPTLKNFAKVVRSRETSRRGFVAGVAR